MAHQFVLRLAILLLLLGRCFNVWAGTITGSFAAVPQGANIDLTQIGTTDWVHWGLHTECSVNRKAGVPPLISNYEIVQPSPTYYVAAYQYADNYNGYTWYDGWRVLAQTNTPTGLWAYLAWPKQNTVGYGFKLKVPADTGTRTLKVYVGTFNARGQFKASMSDGGLAYTDTSLSNDGNGPGGVYTLNYSASSANQTLTIEWTIYQLNAKDGNVTLQAAALTSANPNNPPIVFLDAPVDGANHPVPANIDLAATAADLDGTVSGVEFYQNGTLIGSDDASPYATTWTDVPVGRYALWAVATDNAGGTRTSREATVYVHSSAGALSGSAASVPGWVDLTVEGTADWVHLGSVTNTTVERKAGVAPQLNISPLGTNTWNSFADAPTTYGWSDGTPTTANAGTSSGVFVYGHTNGFRVTAPADTTLRKLRVYVGCYGVDGKLEAYLSDFSAGGYVDRSVQSNYNSDYAVYELDYKAASSGQSLIVNFQAEEMFDAIWGNVNFQAAALQGGLQPLQIETWWKDGSGFHLSFRSESGRNYSLEYSDGLSGSWNFLNQVSGTGGTATATDPNPPPYHGSIGSWHHSRELEASIEACPSLSGPENGSPSGMERAYLAS